MNVFQSNLKGIFVDDCSQYLASRLFGNLKGKALVKFHLMMVLTVVIMFLAMLIVLYQMKRQLVRLLNLVHLECRSVLPNMVDVQ